MALIMYGKNGNENTTLHAGKVVAINCTNGGYCYLYAAVVYHKDEDRVEEIHYERDDYESYNMSYKLGECTIDATDDVMAAYKARLLRIERHNKAQELYNEYLKRHSELELTRLTMGEYLKLARAYENDSKFDWVILLLRVKKFRNEFRKKLNDQIRSWLTEESPKYNRPLSPKQLDCLRPYEPFYRHW